MPLQVIPISVPGDSSQSIFSISTPTLLGSNQREDVFFHAFFTEKMKDKNKKDYFLYAEEHFSYTVQYLSLVKEARIPLSSNISIGNIEQGGKGQVSVSLTTNAVALFVWVEALGFSGAFSDNLITMIPGKVHTLTFSTSSSSSSIDVEKFRQALKVRSLADTFIPGYGMMEAKDMHKFAAATM